MSVKDKPTYLLAPKREDQQLSEKSATLVPAAENEVLEEENGMAGKLNNSVFSDDFMFFPPSDIMIYRHKHVHS
jgi:hypothetical protein